MRYPSSVSKSDRNDSRSRRTPTNTKQAAKRPSDTNGVSRRSLFGLGLGALAAARSGGAWAQAPGRHIVKQYLDDWIGGETSPAEVTKRIALAAKSGGIVRIRSGFECQLTSGLRLTSGTTFECDGARPATFRLLTGPGQFSASDFNRNALSPNRLAIFAINNRDIRIFGINMITDEPKDARTLVALELRNCQNCEIDSFHVHGFAEQDGGYIRINSDRDSLIRNSGVHDCTIKTADLPMMQATCFDIDNQRVSDATGQHVNSHGTRLIGLVCENVTMTAEGIRAYRGLQTDGVKIQGEGATVSISDLTVRNTGQALDLWGDDCLVTGITTSDIGTSPVKLIYGARGNTIKNVTCRGTGLAAVVISDAPRPSDGSTARDNHISNVQATDVGKLWRADVEPISVSRQAAFFINGQHQKDPSRKPSGNFISGHADGYVDNGQSYMPYVGFSRDAGVNTFEIGGTNAEKGFFGSTGDAKPIVRRAS